jgi:hypothetical protein
MIRIMKLYISTILFFFVFTIGCRKEIRLDLPEYEPKMVLEFYLEDNKPIKCLLQESILFTETTNFKLIDSALVVLRHGEVNDTLTNSFYFDPYFGKIYNYFSPKIMHLQPNVEYEVFIRDRKGRELRGATRLNSPVPIDSLVYNFDLSARATVGLIFKDDGSSNNYYRIVAFKEEPAINRDSIWDITFSDLLFNGNQFSFYTGYAFQPGDTVIGRLYHLTEEHHNFKESVNNAQSSNGNPFGQPANIITNLTGGLGIFTALNFSEKNIVIK